MPSLINFVIGRIANSVRASATNNGGTINYSFSQALPPVGEILASFEAASGGVCEMLSAKWIECHAKGTSLKDWLGTPIDASKIRMIMQYFVIGTEMSPKHMIGKGNKDKADQSKATKNYLAARGIRNMLGGQMVEYGYKSTVMERGKGQRRVLAHNLAVKVSKVENPYAMIGAWGPGGAHAMAVRLDGMKVAFFDPNFGEFEFAERGKFVDWLPKFWNASFYGNPLQGLSNKVEVIEYKPGPTLNS